MTCDLACAIALAFGLSQDAAQEHAWHAENAADESSQVDAELLLAVAYAETRLSQDKKHDTWACSKKSGRCSWMCGVGQTYAGHSKRRCREMRESLAVGYGELAKELAFWIDHQRGDLMHAVAGHGCGSVKRKTSLRCGQRHSPGHRRYKAPYPARVSEALKRLRARRAP